VAAGYPATVVDPHDLDSRSAARFSESFAEHAPALSAWAHCRVRGELRQRLDPEDLVQEVGFRACSKREDFDPARGSFRQWLFGFANRVWLEALRELGRDPAGPRHRRGSDSELPGLADSVTTISRRVATDESLRACRARLDELADDDRRLLACVGLEGMSHKETSAVLGIHEDSCRKRWQRLRERLQSDPQLLRLLAG